MIKIHGTSMSRAARSLWAAEELGVKYEHVPVAVPDTRKPEHLKINPNGHIPALEDGGTIVWESMAINLYLAEKYGKGTLWPASVEDHAACYQWSFWAMTELEPSLMQILINRVFAPPEQRNEAAVAKGIEDLQKPLKVLDDYLHNREYILGKQFTIADLNVATVLSLVMFAKLDLSSTPAVQNWLQKCVGRPASQKAATLK
jgi:glutathione S-transferase